MNSSTTSIQDHVNEYKDEFKRLGLTSVRMNWTPEDDWIAKGEIATSADAPFVVTAFADHPAVALTRMTSAAHKARETYKLGD